MKITIGTRGSKLAMYQANLVKEKLLLAHAGKTGLKYNGVGENIEVDVKIIKTTGDKILNASLSNFGGKGLFIKEIEEALSEDSVDIAVHSLKDVPQVIPEEFKIGAALKRDDPRDCIILNDKYKTANKEGIKGNLKDAVSSLKNGAVVGTSSLRRQALISKAGKGLKFEPLRGNIDTRLEKLRNGLYDAIILSSSGLIRLGLSEYIDAYLDPLSFIPQCGQGVIAIEYKKSRSDLDDIIGLLNDEDTALCVFAERACIRKLDCGCASPVGSYAYLLEDGKSFTIKGFVSNIYGEYLEDSVKGDRKNFEEVGNRLALNLIDKGALEILKKNQ